MMTIMMLAESFKSPSSVCIVAVCELVRGFTVPLLPPDVLKMFVIPSITNSVASLVITYY